ncbi:hypothetical protein MBM_04756 [Drepanopeziza brunnea f. sp. 'multigermtubi' MB_m1]|uniref:Uncharacterized protein n=1 Tax=Marssonina brunnea f. sp. multigermtubi (strain MB_m1) TaxID=1072389 RepID=K1XWR3_MARBU|nr:uncharacterized protein MBM_04756 [Drepanopeziza brunnea f. sp. 'multigermtubi' MB_m1]EKD17179.1 hypothetical protein MBM_04756 [Drepanopeziza brunnea f. sp. 'multigermtubi' MB_m1]
MPAHPNPTRRERFNQPTNPLDITRDHTIRPDPSPTSGHISSAAIERVHSPAPRMRYITPTVRPRSRRHPSNYPSIQCTPSRDSSRNSTLAQYPYETTAAAHHDAPYRTPTRDTPSHSECHTTIVVVIISSARAICDISIDWGDGWIRQDSYRRHVKPIKKQKERI